MGKLALISVSDKRGLGRLAPELERLGWRIISTGGTARALRNAGCEVLEVADHTGFPEILDGRVKTLHPKVFAGILAAPKPEHEKELADVGIPTLDLVVVNLYPFRETVSRDGVTLGEAVEQIDIGGPSLLRAAAKNHARVTVLVDPEDYPKALEDLSTGGVDAGSRERLAVKAFRHTAAYDATISAHLPELMGDRRSAAAGVAADLLRCREVELRYGENPHQWGVLARRDLEDGLAGAVQHQGKALSYNNFGDATGAWRLVWDLPSAGVAVIKHANPCGVGLDESMVEAFRKARATDPISAFGGVIAANRRVDGAFAEAVVEQFAEVVIAPDYDPSALEVFSRKKNLRVLSADPATSESVVVRDIDGGFVIQEADSGWDDETWEVATGRRPTPEENSALELAWRVVKHVGSNAIVVGTADRILGIGAGQMSRVDAAKIAVSKAMEMGHDLESSVAASDAFFPFPDGVEALCEAGVRAVIQPGGSIRDDEVVEACDRLAMAMVITGRRHFRH